MKNNYRRREFIKTSAIAGIGLGVSGNLFSIHVKNSMEEGKRVGMIGLDTSHVTAFSRTLNRPSAGPEYNGFKMVAAYPTKGSADLSFSVNRLEGFTKEVQSFGVEIVDSIEELLKRVDVVVLESVDGRVHYEQALPVLKAGKRMFIDKPISSSLSGAMSIFEAAKKYNVPVFSSSATRFAPAAREIVEGKVTGKILGADTYSPTGVAKGHPDMFFYGIHGIESLFTVMGTGCKEVTRFNTQGTDVIVGRWNDDRIGTFRGTPRGGKGGFGGKVFGVNEIADIGEFAGYNPMLIQITEFFRTGIVPVSPEETLEILAFMEAADESKNNNGAPVTIESMMQKAKMQVIKP